MPSSRSMAPPPAPHPPPVSPAQRSHPFSSGSLSSHPYGYRSLRPEGQDAVEPGQPPLVPIPDSPGLELPVSASPLTSPTLMSRPPPSPRPGYAIAPSSYGVAVGRQPASPATRTPWPSSGQPSPSTAPAHPYAHGYISREPSLPSLMSYPVSRAESPATENGSTLPPPQANTGGTTTPVGSFRRRESTRSSFLSSSSSNHWDNIAEEVENALGTTPPSLPRASTSSSQLSHVPFPSASSRFSTISSVRSRSNSIASSVYVPSHLQGDNASLASPASRITDISNFGRAQNRRRMSRSQATSIADGTEYYTRVRDDHEGRGMSRAPSPSHSMMSPTPGVDGTDGFDWQRSSFGVMRREPRDSDVDGDSMYQQSMEGHDSVMNGSEAYRSGSRASTRNLARLDTRLSVPSPTTPGLTIHAPSPRRAGSLPQREHFSSPPTSAVWQHAHSPRGSDASLGSNRLSHYWEQKRSSSPSHYRMWMDDLDGERSLFEVEVKEDVEGELEAERAETDSGHGHLADKTLKPPLEIDGEELWSPDEPFFDHSMQDGMLLPPHLQPAVQQYVEEAPDLQVRPFQPGSRLAVGSYHDGSEVKDFAEFAELQRAERFASEQMGEGRQVELGRVLGIGTYAVVYHAREVVRDASPGGSLLDIQYGTEFALKCLSKANLSEDMLQVQRFEVTLHRSLPAHPNIVQLRRAYETDKWLFILMDYCPGQDLFYWLHERAIAAAGVIQSNDPYSQATPPSPTLLSSTAQTELLSAPRLKLISRMFMQMCAAVAAAHDVGISHRDIKPENFIVHGDHVDGVMVKLTDWGLGSCDELCGDFDTGSKPYMAFECHNNLMPSYDPKGADVWSLGICLINMLFHRSPWMEPALENPEFCAFSEAPVTFLMTRFEGMSRTVANYLADRVFCDVSENTCTRATAKQFGMWVSGLVNHMGGGVKRGSFAQDTIPLEATVSRPSVTIDRNLTDVFHVTFAGTRDSFSDHGIFELEKAPRPTFAKKDLLISTNLDYPLSYRSFEPLSPIEQQSPTTAMPPEPTSATPVEDYRDYPSFSEPTDQFDVNGNPSSISLPEEGKSKRRKREARKKRAAGGDAFDIPPLPSPRTPIPEPEKDEVLHGMAVHVQDYRREISSVTRKASRDRLEPESPGKSPKKTGWRGRVMSLVKDGNPDLQAFKAAVQERDEAIGATSAPAKMQKGSKMTESGISSYSSVGTASWGSWAGTEPEDNSASRPAKPSHWASASNRRARLDKRRGGEETSSSRYGTASSSTVGSVFSRSSRSPISSISSVASVDAGPIPPVPPLPTFNKKKGLSPLFADGRAPVGNNAPSWRVIPPPDSRLDPIAERTPLGPASAGGEFYARRDASGSSASLRSLKRSRTADAWTTDTRPDSSGSATSPTGDSTPKQPNMLSRMLVSIKGHNRG